MSPGMSPRLFRSVACEGCHHHAMLQRHRTELQWREQFCDCGRLHKQSPLLCRVLHDPSDPWRSRVIFSRLRPLPGLASGRGRDDAGTRPPCILFAYDSGASCSGSSAIIGQRSAPGVLNANPKGWWESAESAQQAVQSGGSRWGRERDRKAGAALSRLMDYGDRHRRRVAPQSTLGVDYSSPCPAVGGSRLRTGRLQESAHLTNAGRKTTPTPKLRSDRHRL